jgi:hypothetical protein
MQLKNIPLLDVLARWAYSEIIDSSASHHYDSGNDIASLRAKRGNGLPFEDLSPAERYNLAFQSGCIRTSLTVFTIGAELFDVVEIDRSTLAKIWVPPNIWHPESNGQFVTFEDFMLTSSPSQNDSRNVVLRTPEYQFSADPLTFGRSYDYPLMLDGYHRAALFWKFGPADGKLSTYVPHALLGRF